MTETRTVHPGAFCSPIGATGVTATGTAMVCRVNPDNPPADGRPRWGRQNPLVRRARHRVPRRGQGLEKRYVDRLTLPADAPLPQRLVDQLNEAQIGALRTAGGLPWAGPKPRKADLDKLTRAGLLTNDEQLTSRGVEALRRRGEVDPGAATDAATAFERRQAEHPAPQPRPIVKGQPQDRSAEAGTDWSRYDTCGACSAAAGQPCRDLGREGSLNATAHDGRPLIDRSEVELLTQPTLLNRRVTSDGSGQELVDRNAAKILAAYRAASTSSGRDYVYLCDLRTATGLPAAEFDAAAKHLHRTEDRVCLSPESDQKALTGAQRAGAIILGNQARHMMSA